MVKFSKFFNYCTKSEKIMLAFGTFFAFASGGLLASMAIILGDVTNTFDITATGDEVLDTMQVLLRNIIILGAAAGIAGYFYWAFW